MKVLRIKLKQNSASYAVEETVNNRRTYPLPPFSTVIGALHNACGYTEYQDMKVSVQGKYGSMQREVYTNHGLIDNLHDDRGSLIWLSEANSLNGGYILVAKAINNTGNSFKDMVTINVCDEEKLNEYRGLYLKKDELDKYFSEKISPVKNALKEKEKILKTLSDKSSDGYIELAEEIKAGKLQLKKLEEEFKLKKFLEYEEPRSHFKTLTKGPQTWEVLYDVELVIHVLASDNVMNDIILNRNNIVSLGRSEDFVELIEVKLVDVTDEIDCEYEISNDYYIYANLDRLNREISYEPQKDSFDLGTVFNVSKEYHIEKNLRVFNKIPCLYTSHLAFGSQSSGEGAYIDVNEEITYLLDLN